MKKIITAIFCFFFLSSCDPYITNGVEQKVESHCYPLTQSGRAVRTMVWYNQEVVKSWWDDLDTVTDSIIKLRQRQGDSLVRKLDSFSLKTY